MERNGQEVIKRQMGKKKREQSGRKGKMRVWKENGTGQESKKGKKKKEKIGTDRQSVRT
jgi:hypothetical protein